jgi:hypothetical protein
MFRCALAAMLAAVTVAGTPAFAQDDDWRQLPPATQWNLDFADDSCALRRLFGEEDTQVFLELRQFQPGETMQLIVTSDDIRRLDRGYRFRTSDGVTANFVPDDEAHNVGMPMGIGMGQWGEGIITQTSVLTARERALDEQLLASQGVNLRISDERRDERENEITGLAIGNAFREDIDLQTGNMHAPMVALRECLDELLTHWGIDAEAHRGLLRPAQPLELEHWARRLQEESPMDLLARGEQAIVNVRITVGVDGRASACAVQTSLNESDFDELACELLLRYSRFEPALDGNGDPITSYWVTRVIYTVS